MKLKSYTLEIQEKDQEHSILFECKAENGEHASEQALNAYPGGVVIDGSVRLFDLIVEAFAVADEADSPRYARIRITDQWMAMIQRVRAVLQTHYLTSATVEGWGADWDDEEDYRFTLVEQVICSDSTWFTGYPKNACYQVETRAIYFQDLDLVLDHLAGNKGELLGGYVIRDGNVFLYEGDDEMVDYYLDQVEQAA